MEKLDIQTDMKVLGTDGTELGKVAAVWPYSDGHGYISREAHEISDYGPIGGTEDMMTSDRGYFQVKRGDLLGFGGHELYVPFSDVQAVVPEESITVNCTAGACDDRYKTRPEALDHAV